MQESRRRPASVTVVASSGSPREGSWMSYRNGGNIGGRMMARKAVPLVRRPEFSADYGEGETPVPIPNAAAKPLSADGTALVRVWESRSPPEAFWSERPAERVGRSCCVAKASLGGAGLRVSCAFAGPSRDASFHAANRLSAATLLPHRSQLGIAVLLPTYEAGVAQLRRLELRQPPRLSPKVRRT